MSVNKKKKMRGIRRKSIWPPIILFVFSIAVCLVLVSAFFYLLEMYMMESKMLRICDSAEHLGRIISQRAREEDFLDAVDYARGYLTMDNDICITDKDNRIIECTGRTKPDFDRRESLEMSDSYVIYADESSDILWDDEMILLPPKDMLDKAVRRPEKGRGPEWMQEDIFSEHYWVQIPVRETEYILYFKGSVNFAREDILFLFASGAVGLMLLMIPMFLLFISLISAVVNQKRMIRLMYLDTVTGGNNWNFFQQRTRLILRRIRNLRNAYMMVNIHLDRYEDYCACFGSKCGEELLENINGFLQVRVGRGETFARFAKADFGLLLKCATQEQCERRLRKLLAELTGIHRARKVNYHAGVCMIPAATEQINIGLQRRKQLDIDQIYHYANAARETIQHSENSFVAFFDQKILEDQLWRHKVENTMEAALQKEEFDVYLQPKYNPVSGKLVGAEALVRWNSQEGLITPNRFIPIFEEDGFIIQLDDYMISRVAKLLSEWKIQGRKQIPVSVNVSRANFTREDLAEHICHLVDGYGVPHEYIELELTESAFFGDKEILQKIVRELKLYGFHISMDDFGAGYSSLNSLKDLPIDVLKLDMDFFRGEDTERRGEIVVRETIQLAKNLNMQIVAEGIERREQVEFLAQQGCDMIQGYYYAKPMPISEFNERAEQDS